MRAVSLAGDDQQFSIDFGDRGRIPVGRNAPEQLAGVPLENRDGIVVGFRYQQALAIGAECDGVGRAAFGRSAGRGIQCR